MSGVRLYQKTEKEMNTGNTIYRRRVDQSNVLLDKND